jgi:hypothetical protein
VIAVQGQAHAITHTNLYYMVPLQTQAPQKQPKQEFTEVPDSTVI